MFILLDLISASFPGDGCCEKWSRRLMCCRNIQGFCCENVGFDTRRGFPNRQRGNVRNFVHLIKLFNKISFLS